MDPNGPNSDRTDAACDRGADDSCNLRPIVVDGLIDADCQPESTTSTTASVGLWLFVGTPRFEQEGLEAPTPSSTKIT